jgi:hypothetical protein
MGLSGSTEWQGQGVKKGEIRKMERFWNKIRTKMMGVGFQGLQTDTSIPEAAPLHTYGKGERWSHFFCNTSDNIDS